MRSRSSAGISGPLSHTTRLIAPGQAAACPGAISLVVWDSGPEIPAEERERIFAKGERGSSGARLPGSGLGLALARDLAQQLGGALTLQVPPSQLDPTNPLLPHQGNAFCLQLPAAAPL